MNSAAIFIAVVHLVSPAIIIFELFITFPSDELDYWKEVSYQIRYSVHDEVGGYTIVKMSFHTNMVNSKYQYKEDNLEELKLIKDFNIYKKSSSLMIILLSTT